MNLIASPNAAVCWVPWNHVSARSDPGGKFILWNIETYRRLSDHWRKYLLNSKGSPTILPKEIDSRYGRRKRSTDHHLKNLHEKNASVTHDHLRAVQLSAIQNKNIFAELMEAGKYCSLGQITKALFEVGGHAGGICDVGWEMRNEKWEMRNEKSEMRAGSRKQRAGGNYFISGIKIHV